MPFSADAESVMNTLIKLQPHKWKQALDDPNGIEWFVQQIMMNTREGEADPDVAREKLQEARQDNLRSQKEAS